MKSLSQDDNGARVKCEAEVKTRHTPEQTTAYIVNSWKQGLCVPLPEVYPLGHLLYGTFDDLSQLITGPSEMRGKIRRLRLFQTHS